MTSPSEASASPSPPSVGPKPSKRTKSAQACASCRKQKTRCEMLSDDEKAHMRCHRCTTLKLTCSLELGLGSSSSSQGAAYPRIARTLPSEYLNNDEKLPGFSPYGPPLASNGAPKRMNNPERIWSFVTPDTHDTIDWTSPTQAVQDLLARINLPTASLSLSLDISLENILNQNMIDELLGIFERFYDPWLNFQSMRGTTTPTLDLVRCSVASRHLPASTRAELSPRLHRLAEVRMSSLALHPPLPSVELIQALLIFSLWGPMREDPQGSIRDGRSLISIAISMALSLRLNQISTIISARGPPPYEDVAADQAALWLSLCNSESLMCLGTGCLPMSNRSVSDRKIFQNLPVTSLSGGRDTRLHIQGQLFDLAERGWCIDFNYVLSVSKPASTTTSSETYSKNVRNILDALSLVHDSLSPLSAIVDQEHFHFNMLKLQSLCCHASAIYHCLGEARYAHRDLVQDEAGIPWIKRAETHLPILPELGRTLAKTVESIMEMVLLADSTLLGTAPDAFFRQLTLAGCLVVGIKFLLRKHKSLMIGQLSDQLIIKVAEKWRPQPTVPSMSSGQCALSPDHPAAKGSRLLEQVLIAKNHACQEEVQHPGPDSTAMQNPNPVASSEPPLQQLQDMGLNEPSMFVQEAEQQHSTGPSSEAVYPNPLTFKIFDDLMMSMSVDNHIDGQYWDDVADYSYDPRITTIESQPPAY